jgi:hypothetical protein
MSYDSAPPEIPKEVKKNVIYKSKPMKNPNSQDESSFEYSLHEELVRCKHKRVFGCSK